MDHQEVITENQQKVEPTSILKECFSTKGRIDKKRFAIGFLIVYDIIICTFIMQGFNEALLEMAYPPRLASLLTLLFFFILTIGTVVAAMASIILLIKRLHDINFSGWWFFLFWILNAISKGLLGTLATIILMFIAGTSGSNKFGEDPATQVNKPLGALEYSIIAFPPSCLLLIFLLTVMGI